MSLDVVGLAESMSAVDHEVVPERAGGAAERRQHGRHVVRLGPAHQQQIILI